MIDYEATIRDFFECVYRFLCMREKLIKDSSRRYEMRSAMDCVLRIANNPYAYSSNVARVAAGVNLSPSVFSDMGDAGDAVYCAYRNFVNAMDLYYSQLGARVAQERVLRAKKQWRYVTSDRGLDRMIVKITPWEFFGLESSKKSR